MIYKRCSFCNRRIPAGSKCNCKQKRHEKLKREESESFYDSKLWKKLRKKTKKFYFGFDFYSFYVHGKFEAGRAAHHIIPIKFDDKKKTDFRNLIYVSESSHREIHSLLESDYSKTVELLQRIRAKFIEDFYGG